MINELDVVVLKVDLPAEKLKAGDIGCVVMMHDNGKAFEVEFMTLTGETVAIIALPPDAIRLAEPAEIAHARAAST